MDRRVKFRKGTAGRVGVRQPRHVKACFVPVSCVGERHGEAVKSWYGAERFVCARRGEARQSR